MKRPSIRAWPTIEAEARDIAKWIANDGRALNGSSIGIVTTWTPALDADCMDPEFMAEFKARIWQAFGCPPVRVGRAPKLLMLFRTDEPFKKEASASYIDSEGRRAQLEILGKGQQFVAYGIHPDTNKPYEWTGLEEPLNIRADQLPILTAEMRQTAIDVFEELCEARGWPRKGRSKAVRRGLAESDGGDYTGGPKERLGLTEEELREIVMTIPNNDAPYETAPLSWFNIMAAIHHESGGEEWGYQIAEDWSLLSGKHNSHVDQPNKFDDTWKSLRDDVPNPITARTLIALAREADPDFRLVREIDAVDDVFEASDEPTSSSTPPAKQHRLPIIEVRAGEMPRAIDESEAALIAAGLRLYPRADKIVRPVVEDVPAAGENTTTTIAQLHPVPVDGMLDKLGRVARYQRYDGRSKKLVTIDPPRAIAQQYLARVGEWKLPRLAGIITTPTLRPDGSVLAVAGYDAATALLLVNPPAMPEIPDKPTREDALAALALLGGLLSEFPFCDDASRAVALSGMLTPLVRGAVSVAPMHAATAPSFSSGKSYLWDTCAALSIGNRCPVITAGGGDDEFRKVLSAVLMAGQPIVSIDNVTDALGGQFLAQVLTQQRVQPRILGKSEAPEIESRITIYATGNNLRVRADLVRRTIRAAIDPGVERPELRPFTGNPIKTILAARGRYLAAALTIVRAYIVAGRPDLPPPLGGYDEWSSMVRGPLLWLGCGDPIDTIEKSRDDDPEIEEIRRVLVTWCALAKEGEKLTAAEMLERPGHDFIEVLGHDINSKKLGNWLKRNDRRIIDDIQILCRYDTHAKANLWFWYNINSL